MVEAYGFSVAARSTKKPRAADAGRADEAVSGKRLAGHAATAVAIRWGRCTCSSTSATAGHDSSPSGTTGAMVAEPVDRSIAFSELLFTLPGLFRLPSALPPPAGVCARDAPVSDRMPALSGVALICVLALLLSGCKTVQTAPTVSVIPELPMNSATLPVRLRPKSWSLRLTRLRCSTVAVRAVGASRQGVPMNLLAWTPPHQRHPRTWHHHVLATAERLLGEALPPIDQEPGGRLGDALAALLAGLEGSPEAPAVPRSGIDCQSSRISKVRRA